MTQAHTPAASAAWCQALQLKLMAALDAAWSLIDRSDDPAVLRRARDKAKAIGELAAVARKVGLIIPPARKAPAQAQAATQAVAEVGAMAQALAPVAAPMAAQAEHARRALDKLKGGGRGRL